MAIQISFRSDQYNKNKLVEFFERAGVPMKMKDGEIKHVWSGGKHYFWISGDYVDPDKVKKYAEGYATGAYTLPPPMALMRVEQPFDTRQAQTPARDEQGNYIYETFVDKKEQIANIQSWAEQKGATVERVYAGSEEEAKEFAKKGIGLRILSKEPLPEKVEIEVQSQEGIQKERSEQMARIAGKKIYEEAGPVEKVLLNLQTLLSPKGYEYVGAATREGVAARPHDIQSAAAKTAIDLVFPKVKTTGEVTVENISERLARHARGEYSYSYDIPLAGRVSIDERIVEAVSNPVIDVEFMALGGAGLAKVAATKTGIKVLGSAAGKALLVAGGTAFLGSKGYEVHTLREKGESTKALGIVVTTAAGLAAGTLAYRSELGHILKSVPKTVKVETSKIRGASVTKQKGETATSAGKFEITEGKLKGLTGSVYSKTKGKEGALIVDIPAQKVGGQKIPAQTFLRHTTTNKPLETGIGKIYIKTSKEGRILIDIGKGEITKGPLVGQETEKSYLKETARISETVTDQAGKQSNLIIRKLQGVGLGKTAKDYNVYLVSKGGRVLLVEEKALSSANLRAARIDWVDISVAGSSQASSVTLKPSSTTPVIKVTPAPSVSSIAVPTALNIKIEPVSLGARIVPTVNPVPTGVKIKSESLPELKSIEKVAVSPVIIRREAEGPKGREVLATGTVTAIKTPNIERALEKSRVSYKPVAEYYHPITGQEVTQKQAQVLKQQLEPIIDRLASQPVPVVPVEPSKVGGLYVPSLVPFLRLVGAAANLNRFMTGNIKNPVPDIEKVI